MNNLNEVLIRREDAVRVAEMVNDSIKAEGKFAAAIRMIPAYPTEFTFENMLCPVCGYSIDNEGLCVMDAAHTSRAAAQTKAERGGQ